MGVKYDFAGWATKNDLRCADGRIIRKDAFAGNDGETVSLVWSHKHDGPDNVLGHAVLKNMDDGVYAYCSFNDTPRAQTAKELVKHGDVKQLSIYANHLKQNGADVIHGIIREVSLVIAGANPGAVIDTILCHSADGESEGTISIGSQELELYHADSEKKDSDEEVEEKESEKVEEAKKEDVKEMSNNSNDKTVKDIYDAMSQEKKDCLNALIGLALQDDLDDEEVAHADTDDGSGSGGKTIGEIFKTFTEDEKNVAYALIGEALKNKDADSEEDSEDEDDEGDSDMKHNVFDSDVYMNENVISHEDVQAALADAKRYGSLKESFIAHGIGDCILMNNGEGDFLAHGIGDVEYLFPDAQMVGTPSFIQRDMGWVDTVMNGTKHVPFSRIKTIFANITEADARAKGFIADRTHRDPKTGRLVDAQGKPVMKKEEVFGLLKRVTTPTTVYKKQSLDRDDIVDIKDFDVVVWLKGEMRVMLKEEIARAILVGDGRSISDADKINETNIRPIWTDSDLFTIHYTVEVPAGADEDTVAKAAIRGSVKARSQYKGSGNPTFFATEDQIANMLLLEDNFGHRLYADEGALAKAMRVKNIVSVPVMEGLTRTGDDSETRTLIGLIVNLADYTVGTDKGGETNMFDDFDIDFNLMKYLIEGRCSGCLTMPYSAIALEAVETSEP